MNGPSRKTPHRQRRPMRRMLVALRHRLKVFSARADGGDPNAALRVAEISACILLAEHIDATDQRKENAR